MNKKGFTLAELLGVIIVLGAIMLVVITPIVGQVNKQKSKLDKVALDLIYNTCDTYIDKNKSNYRLIDDSIYFIPLGYLIREDLMDEDFLDSYNEKTLSEFSTVKVTVDDGIYKYELLNNDEYNSVYDLYKDGNGPKFKFNGGEYFAENSSKYVSYNGIKWLILGKNADNSIKILSTEDVTALIYNKNDSTYENSYIRKWLNDEFVGNLSNNDAIVKTEWCTNTASSTTSFVSTCSSKIKDKAGLLTSFEATKMSKSVLNNATNYLLMTQTDSNNYYKIDTSGTLLAGGTGDIAAYVRPVINIKPESVIISGSGSLNDPGVINKNFNVSLTNKTLKDINLSVGTYVNYLGRLYKVMQTGDDSVKLISNSVFYTNSTGVDSGTYTNRSFSDTYNSYNIHSGIGKLVNNDYLASFVPNDNTSNLVTNRSIFNGIYSPNGSNYKITAQKKENKINGAKVGLPKLGDLFAGPITGINYWYQTEFDEENAYASTQDAVVMSNKINNQYTAKVVLDITTDSKITGGKGTYSSPITLGGK